MHEKKQGLYLEMKRYLYLAFLWFGVGCTQQNPLDSTRAPDNAQAAVNTQALVNEQLVIMPGVGISNVLELRMTPQEMKKIHPDLRMRKLTHSTGWVVEAPSLGATWVQEQIDRPPQKIEFLVNSELIRAVPEYQGLSRFRGKLQNGLSFEDETVTRQQVIEKMGSPKYTFTKLEELQQKRDELSSGEPYALRNPKNSAESLYYPQLRISFDMSSNVLISINLYSAQP